MRLEWEPVDALTEAAATPLGRYTLKAQGQITVAFRFGRCEHKVLVRTGSTRHEAKEAAAADYRSRLWKLAGIEAHLRVAYDDMSYCNKGRFDRFTGCLTQQRTSRSR